MTKISLAEEINQSIFIYYWQNFASSIFSTDSADEFEYTSIGYFHKSVGRFRPAQGMAYCNCLGATYYTPNSENELRTLASEFDNSGKCDADLKNNSARI